MVEEIVYCKEEIYAIEILFIDQVALVATLLLLKVGTESTASQPTSRPTRRGRRVAAFIIGAADRESNGRKHD